jgi:hypothetical protein
MPHLHDNEIDGRQLDRDDDVVLGAQSVDTPTDGRPHRVIRVNSCASAAKAVVAPLSAAERRSLAVYVHRVGDRAAALEFAVSRSALARALGNIPVRAGTIALIRLGLTELTSDKT